MKSIPLIIALLALVGCDPRNCKETCEYGKCPPCEASYMISDEALKNNCIGKECH